jgi:hypothetical protein
MATVPINNLITDYIPKNGYFCPSNKASGVSVTLLIFKTQN